LTKEPCIGVISPYKSQVLHIKRRLREVLPETAANVDVNTIDGFQGREKDVILFSTVRTRVGKGKARIGFVADERRINVGLTRARCSLIIVGHRAALQMDYHWGALLRAVSDRGYGSCPALHVSHVYCMLASLLLWYRLQDFVSLVSLSHLLCDVLPLR
jgi:senataxin